MGEMVQKVPYSVWTNKQWRELNTWAASELVDGNIAKAVRIYKVADRIAIRIMAYEDRRQITGSWNM